MSESITNTELQSAVEDVMRKVAPLVDAQKLLHEWLGQNGIYFYESFKGVWGFIDNRPETEGCYIDANPIPRTYSEALIFALEFVKQNLQAQKEKVTN